MFSSSIVFVTANITSYKFLFVGYCKNRFITKREVQHAMKRKAVLQTLLYYQRNSHNIVIKRDLFTIQSELRFHCMNLFRFNIGRSHHAVYLLILSRKRNQARSKETYVGLVKRRDTLNSDSLNITACSNMTMNRKVNRMENNSSWKKVEEKNR